MKAYFDPVSSNLVIDPETDEERMVLRMWDQLNRYENLDYSTLASGAFAESLILNIEPMNKTGGEDA
ncbi:hypothetical protein AB6896_09040 [Rahnella inusitata]|uniref:hypothetical protein n=1 Tax=Rahnella inusitata TaxID=58169 RepID=UPI0039BE4699